MNLLQDIAVEYAFKLKISSRDLAQENLFWVIINKQTGSPCHLDKFMTEKILCENTKDVKHFFYNLQEVNKTDHKDIFKIKMHDLDLNKHVNNATYVEWAVETLPENILKNFTIKKINIVFLKESFYPGQIISKAQINETSNSLITYHSIFGKTNEHELARINIIWKPL
ncbi:MAG: hypothetical protein KAI40_08805 [Desulfobacterales bacterium]|nr:hypothetical protein [Desulfobacterales bacterium]